MKRTIAFFSAFLTFSSFLNAIPEGIEPVQTLDGIEEYRLSANGLRILLKPEEGLPVATVMVTYEVGSRNEVTGTTGATHILEHMMFKGTDAFNSADGSSYSQQMERIGARSNATTYFDRTNYYATLPREYIPLAIELEADRMRGLRIREEDLASEMTVVRNEYERGENNPVRTLIKEIFAAAYIAQPYGHPTIGWKSDIENTSPEKLRAFYDTYYWPENAVLTVIGGLDRDETLESILKFYGKIPPAPQAIPVIETVEPEQLGPRHVVIERTGQIGVVMIAFKVPEGIHEDWAALALIEQIVGADKTGRLYRSLEDKGKASATFTFAPQLRDPGLFMFAAYLTPEASHEEAEAIILEEIEKLAQDGVEPDELARAKSVIKASTVYGRDGPYAIADQINETIALGDWTKYVTQPEAIQDVTAEQIKEVAAKYFVRRSRTTGWFVPQKSAPPIEMSSVHYGPNYFRTPQHDCPMHGMPLANTADGSEASSTTAEHSVDFSSQMQTATVSGIQIIAIDMPVNDVVSFVGGFAAGSSLSPADSPALASLTASMLDKATQGKDRFEIAEQLDTLGAELGFSAGSHSLNFSGRFLRDDAAAVLKLLAEQLREPRFDPEVLATLKSRQKAGLLNALDNPDYRADTAVDRFLYPKGHPNYSETIDTIIDAIESTTAEQLIAFHEAFYGPQSMTLVFAGDIDFPQLIASVASAFDGWTGGIDYPEDVPDQLENASQTERIHINDKTSVSVRYAQNTGLQRTDPDYLPFMVGNYILGSSFHSRLMTEVRKNQGLTYSIHSRHEGDILTKGNWKLSASFSPELLDQGLTATEAVVEDWHENGVTDAEVNRAIQTLKGSYLVGLSTTGSVAGQVLSFVQRGFEPEYIDIYPSKLTEISTEKVNQAIRQYIDPSKSVRVLAGSLPEEPSPLETPMNAEISVRLDTPDSGWRIQIDKVYQTSDSIIVISKLSHDTEIAAQVISTVSDAISIPMDSDMPVRHYIIGKTWNWGASGNYAFIESESDFGTALYGANLLYSKE